MKVFKTIYYICIAFIGVIVILLIISVFPITGSYKTMIVQSGSMNPEIKLGSIIVIKQVDDYKIGDIISFGRMTKTETPITHRIYDMKVVGGELQYVTKGDENNAPDKDVVLKKDIIGKVLFDIPYLGYIVNFIKKPIGFSLLIIIPAVVIIFEEIKKIYVEIKRKKAKNTK